MLPAWSLGDRFGYSVGVMDWSTIALAVGAFVLMEPVTAATHRWVMHGIGEMLHRSHHQARRGRFERNDWFPVLFAAIVIVGFAAGFNIDGWSSLVPVGIGVTAYGVAYAPVSYTHLRAHET